MREARLLRRDPYGSDVGVLPALVCTNPWERARGLLGRPPLPDATALVIDPCRAVHTVGMRTPIDVAFCSARGVVLRLLTFVPPGRIAIVPEADHVLEFRAGETARLGLRVGDRLLRLPAAPGIAKAGSAARPPRAEPSPTVTAVLAARAVPTSAASPPVAPSAAVGSLATAGRQRGAATVEFTVIALLALLPLVLGILQLGLLYSAKHALNHATFLAARAGAVQHGSRDAMERHLAKGLVGLKLRADADLDANSWPAAATAAWARAYAEVRLPTLTRLRILNPTSASFADFGRATPAGREIPNDPRLPRRTVGAASGQTLAEANLLRIRVDHCHPLVVPLVDRLLTGTLRRFDPDPFRQGCYAQNRLAIRSSALLHMASAPQESAMGI